MSPETCIRDERENELWCLVIHVESRDCWLSSGTRTVAVFCGRSRRIERRLAPDVATRPGHINITLPEWDTLMPGRMDIRDNIAEALERIDSLTNQATTYERYKLSRVREILRSCMDNEALWRHDQTACRRTRELVDFLGVYSRHQRGLDVCRFDADGYLVPKAVDTETLLEKLSDDTLEEANLIGSFLGVPQEREEPWNVVINTRATASRRRESDSRQRRPGSVAECDIVNGDEEAEDSDPFSDEEEDEDAVWVDISAGHRWWYI
ncbi:hypothetical protein EDB80DRAFT_691505 [Ilyonectria destructans]|nr:hypothetical protein EDB80DRAFT_691505 [Ilyonectria destructans]